ncbi:nucleosidase [Corynebacterium diphtheriae]|nr:nucleosidase [Corynebacterium diphtheriae]CAB0862048.1 nucleosidase [Corynebacterium diphtheriae]CAB0970065.1 nucleosidase [Corynebacterium diphtheriae]CAB1023211.1 nucleosidase [Corynebacterium diphtheriae]
MGWLGLAGVGGHWWARHPPLTPEKPELHTKSAQTAGLEAIWCEVLRKILRNTPV